MKNKNQWRKAQWWMMAASALALVVLATACGKKEDGGIAVAPGTVNPLCVGCPASGGNLATAVGKSFVNTSTLESEISLQFIGDAATMAQSQNPNVSSGARYYSGSVSATGVLRIRVPRTAVGSYGCNVPAGDYSITTSSPGQMSGLIFQQMNVVATGPAQLQITLYRNSLWNAVPAALNLANQQFPYYLVSDMVVTASSAGGARCNTQDAVFYLAW